MSADPASRIPVFEFIAQAGRQIQIPELSACDILDVLHNTLTQRARQRLPPAVVVFDSLVNGGLRREFVDESPKEIARVRQELTTVLQFATRAVASTRGVDLEKVRLDEIRELAMQQDRLEGVRTHNRTEGLRIVFGPTETDS